MPTGLKRFQLTGDLHFITFSCHRRKPFLAEPEAYATVEQALEDTRKHDGFFVAGYVFMPEHLHMLLSEPPGVVLAAALKRLKWSTSRELKGTYRDHFWHPATTTSTSTPSTKWKKSWTTCTATRSNGPSPKNPKTGHGAAPATTNPATPAPSKLNLGGPNRRESVKHP